MAEGGLATAAQWRQNCASASGFTDGSPSMVRVGLAPEWLGDASQPDSEAQNGLACGGSWGRLAAPARFGQSIHAGGAPIYRGNPSTHSRRGDDLDSISNLKQTRRITTDFGKGINSVWRTLCGYEWCRVHLWIR
jgi:hypothetical protein